MYRADAETGEWIGAEKAVASDLGPADAFGMILASSEGRHGRVRPRTGFRGGCGLRVRAHRGRSWVEADHLVGEMLGPPAITGAEVECSDAGEAALFGCSGVDLLAFLPLADLGAVRGSEMNDVWGWTDPETGREIVIAGTYEQSVFVDVSDPTSPVYLGRLPMTEGPTRTPGAT